MKESNILKASVLSGYSRSSYYYRHKQPVISRNRRTDSAEGAVLEAIEKVALEYPSYGVRRITAMLHRSGITANRKKVYRIMKLANLVRKRSVRRHVIIKSSRLSLGKLPSLEGYTPVQLQSYYSCVLRYTLEFLCVLVLRQPITKHGQDQSAPWFHQLEKQILFYNNKDALD